MCSITTVDNREDQSQEGTVKSNTWKHLVMIKDSNKLQQAWKEFMKFPSLEVLRNRQINRIIYVLLIVSSDRRMGEVLLLGYCSSTRIYGLSHRSLKTFKSLVHRKWKHSQPI